MNTRKFSVITAAAAMLITAAGMIGIAHYTNATADSVRAATPATAEVITTLPTITVRPTREQLQQLRKEGNPVGSVSAASSEARMPYYSFASDGTGA